MAEIKAPKIEEKICRSIKLPKNETVITICLFLGLTFTVVYLFLQCDYYKFRADFLYQQNTNTNNIKAIVDVINKAQQQPQQ